MKISMQLKLDSKVLILKILTEKKKSCLNSKDNFNKFQKLISTDHEVSISILIGLDCRDPEA